MSGGASSYCLDILYNLLLQLMFRTFCPSFNASLEPLAHFQNLDSLSLLLGKTLVHLNWLKWFHFLMFTRYLYRFHNFPVIIPRCYKDVFVRSFFPCFSSFSSFTFNKSMPSMEWITTEKKTNSNPPFLSPNTRGYMRFCRKIPPSIWGEKGRVWGFDLINCLFSLWFYLAP